MKSLPNTFLRRPILLAVLALAATASLGRGAVVILEDSFSYTGWSSGGRPMQTTSNWQLYAGQTAAPTFISLDSGTDTALVLNNRGIRQTLPTTLTQDFQLTLTMQQDAFQRLQYVMLTSAPDANGYVYGYGFAWDAARADLFNGQGSLQIRKISLLETSLGTGTAGTAITSSVASGVAVGQAAPTLSSQFATITLTWNQSGLLTLSVNGIELATVTDTSYASFSNIYIDGNTNGYFDSVLLTTSVPEPATVGAVLLGAGVLGVAHLRRRKE